MKLSEFALHRPVTTVMITLSLIVLGLVSLQRLPLEQMPTISSSGISVNISWQSSSPEEVQRRIILPLEETLGTLSNVDGITANAYRGGAWVRVNFAPGTNMDLANMELRERVDLARAQLPPDVDRIRLRRWQTDQRPIVDASMAWRGPGDRLPDIARRVIEPRLLRLNGVANVEIHGLQERQLTVELDQSRLQAHDVSMHEVARVIRSNNVNVSLGYVEDGGRRFISRAIGEFGAPDEIGSLVIPGTGFRLHDVGEVVYDFPERRRYDRLNGVDAVRIQVYRAPTANVVEVGRAVSAELDRIRAQYDGDLDIRVIRDRSARVLRELGNLTRSALLGAFLAVTVILVFLRNIRSTLAVAIAIPTAALCVFTGMYIARELFGSTITLNMVTMMGLMLAVGMLVDPAVVTLESIYRRRTAEGDSPMQAASRGSSEIGMAVLASSLTTICVFVPFFFLSTSRSALWLRDAGIAICLAVVVSMVVALTLIPLASSRLFREGYSRYDRWIAGVAAVGVVLWSGWQIQTHGLGTVSATVAGWITGAFTSLAGMAWTSWIGITIVGALLALLIWYAVRYDLLAAYGRLLSWTLDHRLVTLTVTAGMLGLGIFLYSRMEQRGTPWTPERRVDITVQLDRSYSLEEVRDIFTDVEQTLLARTDSLDIETLSTWFTQRRGRIQAYLVDADDGHLTTQEAGDAVMALMPERVGVEFIQGRRRSWSGPELGVEVRLRGRSADMLNVLVEDVRNRLEQLPGVQDVDTSLEDGDEEVRVTVDREQALSYGLSPQQVAATISQALGTRRTSTFKAREREIDIVVQLREEDRATLEQLQNTHLEGRDGTPIQLATLASFRLQRGPRGLRRQDRELNVSVFANTATPRETFALTPMIQEMMESVALPPGYSWELGDSVRWAREDARDNNFTMLFALLLIYLIMASLFESLIHPFTIMLSIPFSLIGVFIGLSVLRVPFDNNTVMGLLILFGIVVNNGIVLIDHINHYRREGMTRREAIIRGGQNRLRPIAMTASTTILNLMPLVLPMLYGTVEGFSRRWGPVGLVVVSGLASSTILTLVLAPTLYALMDDLGEWAKRVVRAVRGPARMAGRAMDAAVSSQTAR